jgi:hypothetical protein
LPSSRQSSRCPLLTWSLSYLFFEFLGPFNLLGEPAVLVLLELSFWAVASLVEASVVVSILERKGGLAS